MDNKITDVSEFVNADMRLINLALNKQNKQKTQKTETKASTKEESDIPHEDLSKITIS